MKNLTIACHRLAYAIGIDLAVGFTIAGRAWLAVAGVITLMLVGYCMSPGEQGYYYTFGSLLALQVFVELGLTNVILQFASHERAHLESTSCGVLDGDPDAKSRLASLLRLMLQWYGIAAILFVALLLPAGYFFFTHCASGATNMGWHWPWVGTVLATAGTLVTMPVLAFLEGCGRVVEVARFRILQSVIANVTLWLALLGGAGLRAAPMFALVSLLAAAVWIFTSQRAFLVDLLTLPLRRRIVWKEEIWPYQWRIAISWLSGYCIFQLFVPVLFAYQGAAEAGQMGMALSLSGAVSTLGLSWLTTKVPRFGMLVSLRQFDELDRIFDRATQQAVGVSMFGAGLLLGAIGLLNLLQNPLAIRLLSPLPLALLLVATVVNVIVSAEATYLRAFKREPFLVISVLNALLIGCWTCSVGRTYGALGMMVGYMLINGAVGLGLGT